MHQTSPSLSISNFPTGQNPCLQPRTYHEPNHQTMAPHFLLSLHCFHVFLFLFLTLICPKQLLTADVSLTLCPLFVVVFLLFSFSFFLLSFLPLFYTLTSDTKKS